MTSNLGHLLGTGLLDAEQAADAERLKAQEADTGRMAALAEAGLHYNDAQLG